MNAELEYLRWYLEDEFRGFSDVRIRIRQKTGVKRSPDLAQDYNPESHSLHSLTGVEVRTKSRDYFFPETWAAPDSRPQVNALIREIRDFLGAN